MPRLILRHLLNLISFICFLGAFLYFIQRAFWVDAPGPVSWLLWCVPALAYLLAAILYPPESAPRLNRGLRFLTTFLVWGTTSALAARLAFPAHTLSDLLPWRPTFSGEFLLVFLLCLGAGVGASLILRRVRLTSSLWGCLVLTTLAWMMIFSYFYRTWVWAYPLHFIGGLAFHGLSRHNTKFWPWLSASLAGALLLGALLPTFSPIWFQHSFTKDSFFKFNSAADYATQDELLSWNTFQVGQPIQPSDQPQFYVYSSKPQYWRSEIYDTFTGWSWFLDEYADLRVASSPIRFQISQPNQEEMPAESGILNLLPLAGGYGLPLPMHPYTINTTSSQAFSLAWNQNILRTLDPLNSSTYFQITSGQPSYTADDLRQVSELPEKGTGYLVWGPWAQPITNLAYQLTEDKTNPYDKIMALVDYLKNYGSYTLDPKPPSIRPGPASADIADPSSYLPFSGVGTSTYDIAGDFLFDTGEGYCVHYSVSLLVMAQRLGYPARWVVGFSEGSPLPAGVPNPFPDQPSSSVRVLTQSDAHSWVEIYFPGYGWIPFEATPGFSLNLVRDPLSLPETTPSSGALTVSPTRPSLMEDELETSSDTTSRSSAPVFLWTGLGLLILILLILKLPRLGRVLQFRLLSKSEPAQVRAIYVYWRKRLTRLGIPFKAHATIQEHARQVSLLGAEWAELWNNFSKLVEQALYSANPSPQTLAQLLAAERHLYRLYRAGKKISFRLD